jgi:hypothetical protein
LIHPESYGGGWNPTSQQKFFPGAETQTVATVDLFFMSHKKEIISTINGLIETLRDRQAGFKQSANGVDDPQPKTIFDTLSRARRRRSRQRLPGRNGKGTAEMKTAHDKIRALRDTAAQK